MDPAELLSVGSELLLGETVDTNAAFLGGEMARLGLPLRAARMLPDDRERIREAVTEALIRSRVVLVSGGLGPTHDDVTREGVADALGERLAEDAELAAGIRRRFASAAHMPETNLRQAMLIPSARFLRNPIGSAPGWWVERDDRFLVLMPGVPSEMRLMWTDEVLPRLRASLAPTPLVMRTVKAYGTGESAIAERLGSLLDTPRPGVSAGIYARDDGIHVRFASPDDPSAVDRCVADALQLLGADAYGTDDDHLADIALGRLGAMGAATLASWESETGGALMALLSEARRGEGARYVGGTLDVGGLSGPPIADAVLQLSLLDVDGHGRSPIRVSVSGAVTMPITELRVHGSGPQRLRRAAAAALDAVRRLSPSDR